MLFKLLKPLKEDKDLKEEEEEDSAITLNSYQFDGLI